MAKLRHIALSVQDLDKSAKFFVEAFDMKIIGTPSKYVCYVSDGTMNVALLAVGGKPMGYDKDEPFYGIDHFGMWVDDLAEAQRKAEAAGATYVMGVEPDTPDAFYEVKYRDPMGNVFDLTANGWDGATKEVVPAKEVVSA